MEYIQLLFIYYLIIITISKSKFTINETALFFGHRTLLQELQNKGNSIAENKDYR